MVVEAGVVVVVKAVVVDAADVVDEVEEVLVVELLDDELDVSDSLCGTNNNAKIILIHRKRHRFFSKTIILAFCP